MTEKCTPVKCSLTAKSVLMWLAHHHNADTGRCNPSVELIAVEGCMTTRSVGNALKELKAAGHIHFTYETGKRYKFTINPRTTFTPERDSPPKEIPITPEGDSDRPPNVVPKPPKEIPTNSKEQESKQELNSNTELFQIPKVAKKNKARCTLDELKAYAAERGLPESDGEFLFDTLEAKGWKNVHCWKSQFRKYQGGRDWLPSMKAKNGHRQSAPGPDRNAGTANQGIKFDIHQFDSLHPDEPAPF